MRLFILAIFLLFAVGCASSSTGGATTSDYGYSREGRQLMRTPTNYNTRAHPAAFVVDLFEVPKHIQEPAESPVPFYFKTCAQEIGAFTGTNSRYDCDYP